MRRGQVLPWGDGLQAAWEMDVCTVYIYSKGLLLLMCLCVCVNICHIFVSAPRSQRECWIPWSWSYRPLSDVWCRCWPWSEPSRAACSRKHRTISPGLEIRTLGKSQINWLFHFGWFFHSFIHSKSCYIEIKLASNMRSCWLHSTGITDTHYHACHCK